MASRTRGGVLGRLLAAFGVVSILALAMVLLAEGLGIGAGLDAAVPGEEAISRRVHGFLYRWATISGLVAIAVGVALAGWFTVQFVRPVRALASCAEAFAAGARQPPCEVGSSVRELDELARAFHAMADAVRAHEASRNRLLSDIAHELRSPLTVVTGQLEELRDGLIPADPQSLAAVHAECQRLVATAEDLAAVAAAAPTAAPISSSALDLGNVARQAAAVRRTAFRDKGLRLLDSADHVVICTDEVRVRQILGNLLDNCWRYCAAGDQVVLSTRVDGLAWLIVDDSGPGMSPAERRLATRHGYRGPRTADVPGTGAGLALVRGWAEALGGRLVLDQSAMGGLRAAVGLPMGECPENHAAAAVLNCSHDAGLAGRTVRTSAPRRRAATAGPASAEILGPNRKRDAP